MVANAERPAPLNYSQGLRPLYLGISCREKTWNGCGWRGPRNVLFGKRHTVRRMFG